ncbi:MAG: hypothetical protein ABSG02_10900 [Terriglobales bacterium]|jgi:hypothetical protein
MPGSKYKFAEQQAYDHDIDTNTDSPTVIGTLRIKPSTILWKPKGAKGNKPYFAANLDEFIEWIKEKNHKVSK